MRQKNAARRLFAVVMLALGCILLLGMRSAFPGSTGHLIPSAPAAPSTLFQGWSSLGRPSSYSLGLPVRGVNLDGRQELFAKGSNGEIWHAWQTAPSGNWSGWSDFVGQTMYCAAVQSNADGRMELFSLWADHAIWHAWQGVPNGPFSSWASFGWPPNQLQLNCPRAGRNQDGRIEVFSIASDGNVWTMVQKAPSDGWAYWQTLGKPSGRSISNLAWGHDADGREVIYVLGDDYSIYFKNQIQVNDGWSGWVGFPNPSGVNLYAPAIGWNQDGRQELFALGDDGNVYTVTQANLNDDVHWYGWGNLGKPPTAALHLYSRPVVGQTGGRIEVFAQTYGGDFWHIGQNAANDGWGGWSSLGQPPGGLSDSDATIGNDSNGRLVLFAVGNDGAIWRNTQALGVYLPLLRK